MLGRVMQILTQTGQYVKEHYIVTALNWIRSLKPISVFQQVIGSMTHTVQAIKHNPRVLIQWSIKQLHVLSLTLLAWLTKAVTIIVKLIHMGLGLLHQKIVALHQLLVLKRQKLNKEPAE